MRFHSKCHTPRGRKRGWSRREACWRAGRWGGGGFWRTSGVLRELEHQGGKVVNRGRTGTPAAPCSPADACAEAPQARRPELWQQVNGKERTGSGFQGGHKAAGQGSGLQSPEGPLGFPMRTAAAIANGNQVWAKISPPHQKQKQNHQGPESHLKSRK